MKRRAIELYHKNSPFRQKIRESKKKKYVRSKRSTIKRLTSDV